MNEEKRMIGKLEKRNNMIGTALNKVELEYYNLYTEYMEITISEINRQPLKHPIRDTAHIHRDFLELRSTLIEGLGLKIGDLLKFRLTNAGTE
jgi:hypothetical protein